MDAVDSEVMGVAEMLFNERHELIEELESGGDPLIRSSLWIDPKFRGDKIGHTVLIAILGTAERATALVVLLLTENGPEEGSPERKAASAGLLPYWIGLGFEEAAGDYLVLSDLADMLA